MNKHIEFTENWIARVSQIVPKTEEGAEYINKHLQALKWLVDKAKESESE